MEIDENTVRKIGRLARIRIEENDFAKYQKGLTQILSWVDQLSAVNTDGIAPLTSVHIQEMPIRADVIHDGGQANAVLANAPDSALNMFAVPKVVE